MQRLSITSRKSDLLIGVLDESTLPKEEFLPSRHYYYDELTWCVQKRQPIPIWRNFFILSNDPMVWIICFSTFGIVTFIFYYLQQFETLQPKWNAFRIAVGVLSRFIGMPYNYNATNISSRVLFAIGMFGCIIFVSSFISIMMTSMNKQLYTNQVETIEEILDLGFDLAGDSLSLKELLKLNEVGYLSQIKVANSGVNINLIPLLSISDILSWNIGWIPNLRWFSPMFETASLESKFGSGDFTGIYSKHFEEFIYPVSLLRKSGNYLQFSFEILCAQGLFIQKWVGRVHNSSNWERSDWKMAFKYKNSIWPQICTWGDTKWSHDIGQLIWDNDILDVPKC